MTRSDGPGTRRAGAARRLALVVLRDVDERGAYVNLALDQALEGSRLSPADRALVTELVYGVTRWRGRLDYVLDRLSRRPVDELPAWIRNILRMGLYQILYLDRIPARAAVFESVALAREFGHRGTAGLVNAVLRQATARGRDITLPPAEVDPARRLAVEHSLPEWLVRRWLRSLGFERTVELCRVSNEAAPLTLRANAVKTSREELLGRLRSEGVEARPGRYFPEAVVVQGGAALRDLPAYREGLFSVQDESAMSAARAVAPWPGWLVVDACAGVGGKATHLAELMGDRGRVVAVDLFEHKLRLLRQAAGRLGLDSVTTRRLDARTMPETDLAQTADAVLVDAPCSGLGVLRRRPDLRWRLQEADIEALARLQAEILDGAAACVRPGGVLVYATCTVEPAENEAVVEGFLARNLEFEADDAAGAAGLKATAGRRSLSFWPESGGPDGFFVSRLVRRGQAGPGGSGG